MNGTAIVTENIKVGICVRSFLHGNVWPGKPSSENGIGFFLLDGPVSSTIAGNADHIAGLSVCRTRDDKPDIAIHWINNLRALEREKRTELFVCVTAM